MDDKGTAVLIKKCIEARGQSHSTRDGIERTFAVIINRKILEIAQVVRVIAKTRVD